MSGLEVAGLVLGVLPLAIKALESYRSTLSSMRSVAIDLESMIRDLGTEHHILQNTCETLLQGIVPDSEIDAMIEDPFGPNWKTFDNQLRLRLWRSCEEFQLKVTEMQVAIQELQEKLSIQADGKTKLQDRRSILMELKRNFAFTLKKKDYDNLMSRIKAINSALCRLAQQNNHQEPFRRSRSQIRVAKLIGKLSSGIFRAMQNAITCSCFPKHSICLELEPRNVVMVPGDLDNEVAEKIDFNVVLGSQTQNSERWNPFRIHLSEANLVEKAATPLREALVDINKKATRPVKRARFADFDPRKESISAMQVMAQVSAGISGFTATLQYEPQAVTNICLLVSQGEKGMDCCGVVSDLQDKFKMYKKMEGSDSYHITLRHVLESRDQTRSSFGYPERLRLALALSASVLHLYSTPWLSSIITLDDVVFIVNNNPMTPKYIPYRPFVAKTVPGNPDYQMTAFSGMTRPMDLTLLSLGTLLIQIIIGQPINSIDMAGDTNIDSVLGKQSAATQLRGLVMQSGGMNYDAAVQWCLEGILGVATLKDDGFRQNFHEAVVSRLEADAKLALST